MFSNTFAGIAPSSVPMFVLMQFAGGIAACLLVRVLYPDAAKVAAEIVDEQPAPAPAVAEGKGLAATP
jgi:arsenate reductase